MMPLTKHGQGQSRTSSVSQTLNSQSIKHIQKPVLEQKGSSGCGHALKAKASLLTFLFFQAKSRFLLTQPFDPLCSDSRECSPIPLTLNPYNLDHLCAGSLMSGLYTFAWPQHRSKSTTRSYLSQGQSIKSTSRRGGPPGTGGAKKPMTQGARFSTAGGSGISHWNGVYVHP